MNIWVITFYDEHTSGDFIHFLNRVKIWRRKQNVHLSILSLDEFLSKKEIPDVIIPRL